MNQMLNFPTPSITYDDDTISRLYDTHLNDLFLWSKTFTSNHELIEECILELFVWSLKKKEND